MLYSLAAQELWPDQKCLFTLRSGDLGGTMLLWRPWWHHAAVGPRALVVHAGGALGYNSVRTGVGGSAAGRACAPGGQDLARESLSDLGWATLLVKRPGP